VQEEQLIKYRVLYRKRVCSRGGVYRTKETIIRRKINMEKQRNKIKRVLRIAPLSIENPEWIYLFFNDSIHTYFHIKKELSIIKPKIKKEGAILCDNIGGGHLMNF
jgi:hypothetical protein